MSNLPEDKPADFKLKRKHTSGEKKFKPPKKISERYLHNSGLAYLQRFPTSTHHFRSVMTRKINKSCHYHKDQDPQECAKLLDQLIIKFQELALLDDKTYLKGMVSSYRRRGLSAKQIELKLQQKGFDRTTIGNELSKHDQQEYECGDQNGDLYAAITFARKKRLGPFDVENKKPIDKALASMARAGFGYDIAMKTLEMSDEELQEHMRSVII